MPGPAAGPAILYYHLISNYHPGGLVIHAVYRMLGPGSYSLTVQSRRLFVIDLDPCRTEAPIDRAFGGRSFFWCYSSLTVFILKSCMLANLA